MTALFGKVTGLGLLVGLLIAFNGYALSVLWAWFVVPIFGGPELGLIPSIGIMAAIICMTYQIRDYKKEQQTFRQEITRIVALALLRPSLALFFGWIVKVFM